MNRPSRPVGEPHDPSGDAMMLVTCRCGAALLPTAPSCGRCGARPLGPAPRPLPPATAPVAGPFAPMPAPMPAPTRAPEGRAGVSAWVVSALVGLTAVSLLLAGVAAFLYLRPAPAAVAAPAPVVVTAPSTPSTATTDVAAGTSGSTGTSASSSDGGSHSATILDDVARSDSAAVESLTGWWVPQLSSKKVGTVAHGRTYDSADILDHYTALQGQVPGALLLWSGDWPVFTNGDYWVVVAPRTFGSAAAANAWCDAQGFGPDDCLARRLSHSGGPSGSSVPRS
jgi:hypothetical protein